jgi:hypothetical protein
LRLDTRRCYDHFAWCQARIRVYRHDAHNRHLARGRQGRHRRVSCRSPSNGLSASPGTAGELGQVTVPDARRVLGHAQVNVTIDMDASTSCGGGPGSRPTVGQALTVNRRCCTSQLYEKLII